MLKRNFDPAAGYRAAVYLRMSSELQNKRSPTQQHAEIERVLKSLGYKWDIVAVYCDDAKSGRLLRYRRDYQRMLRDIRTGSLIIDLILVDTLERFGRVDELPTIRKKLYEEDGVLVLTADSGFVDPLSPAGAALGVVETVRATEHGRIMAHNVLRGKRDAVQQKHWPGGAPPFGHSLKSILKTVSGREEVDYCLLVRNSLTDWIIALLFETAARTAWGTTRLARFLTEHTDIPEEYKPFQPSTIGYWLGQEIYYGELVWPKNATGIVSDRRVREPNATEDMLRIPNFTEPIVDKGLWDEVQRLRQMRSDRIADARARKLEKSEKHIMPPAPGMTVKYLLSGLLFCGECGLRMIAMPSSPYTTKSGTVKRYTVFACPGAKAGHCKNSAKVPEEWLRGVVVEKLRDRLFPGAG
jgi:site-specific DNA recombinase